VANAAYSRVSVKSQTVIPREVRERLGLKPGDRLRYRLTPKEIVIERAPPLDAEWLASLESTLTEWSSEEDAAAYDDL
jgi:AbrB family looped-hinge helix DNA binding protein